MPIEIAVPDIGDFKDVPVIEVHVRPGDAIAAEEPLITLESDKATLDVPAPQAGTVAELRVKLGDRVSQGSVILLLEPAGAAPVKPKETVHEDASPAPETPPNYGSPSGVYETIDNRGGTLKGSWSADASGNVVQTVDLYSAMDPYQHLVNGETQWDSGPLQGETITLTAQYSFNNMLIQSLPMSFTWMLANVPIN